MKNQTTLPFRRLSISAMGAAALLIMLMVMPSGAARAATVSPSTAGQYCGVYGTGTTGAQIENGYTVSTVWTKPKPGCNDFNLVYVDANGECQITCQSHAYDYYEGAYLRNGTWVAGASGFHQLYNGNVGDVVLLTNVATGAKLSIESHNLQDTVHVNY